MGWLNFVMWKTRATAGSLFIRNGNLSSADLCKSSFNILPLVFLRTNLFTSVFICTLWAFLACPLWKFGDALRIKQGAFVFVISILTAGIVWLRGMKFSLKRGCIRWVFFLHLFCVCFRPKWPARTHAAISLFAHVLTEGDPGDSGGIHPGLHWANTKPLSLGHIWAHKLTYKVHTRPIRFIIIQSQQKAGDDARNLWPAIWPAKWQKFSAGACFLNTKRRAQTFSIAEGICRRRTFCGERHAQTYAREGVWLLGGPRAVLRRVPNGW